MATHIAVASFSPETDLPSMMTVLTEEVARVRQLTAEGRLRAVHISPARGRAFLEVMAESEDEAKATVESLPMAQWWEIEVYPTMVPPDQQD